MSNFNIKSDSQDSDNQVLLPINSLHPPNELISKKYSPDIKPTFRLISPEKKEKKKISFPTEPPPSYLQFFDQCDTLGYEYSYLLRNKLVYLKYNNAAYMKLNLNGKSIRYLGGMFIPLEKLLSDNLRKNKNIFKTLSNLEYTDNKHPVDSSFGPNCYTEAPNIRFSSNYEGSNLFAAVKTGDNEYDLILQNDTNSKGNTQWFNFTVEISEQKNYKFNIVNLTKSSSLYQKGMSVAYFSQNAKLNHRIGWSKGCHSIQYYPTQVLRENSQNSNYHCLHFQYKSLYKNDVVTFAYSFPYNLIDLERFFNKVLIKRPVGSLKIERIKIAQTLTGFSLNAYAFTQKKYYNKKMYCTQTLLEPREQGLPSVVFMARQHPGQSQGSYVAEGIVQWLLEGDYDCWKKSFQFYVIPMVNMDGVFYGNYRTNLSGNDLNRIWRHPRKDYHCEIHSLKKFLHSLNKTNPISLIIDLHGHSNSLNSFFYGNPPPRKDSQNPKLFPYYCSRKVKQISFNQSTFSITEDKKTCARVVLSEMFPKAMVYTFESSFYGWKRGKTVVEHTIDSYRKLGRDLVQCFVEYSRLSEKNPSIKDRWVKQIEQFSKDSRQNQEEIVSDSDSDVGEDLISFEEMKIPLNDDLNSPDINRDCDKKKSMPSIGKNQFLRYMRRHSPIKLRNYTSNENYIMDKSPQPAQQPQGFLSIVKINTRSHLDSAQGQRRRKTSINKESKDVTNKDFVVEDFDDGQKQNDSTFHHSSKGSKLIAQKQLIIEKMRQKRRKLEEGMIHSKTFNGFFRYNFIKKP